MFRFFNLYQFLCSCVIAADSINYQWKQTKGYLCAGFGRCSGPCIIFSQSPYKYWTEVEKLNTTHVLKIPIIKVLNKRSRLMPMREFSFLQFYSISLFGSRTKCHLLLNNRCNVSSSLWDTFIMGQRCLLHHHIHHWRTMKGLHHSFYSFSNVDCQSRSPFVCEIDFL